MDIVKRLREGRNNGTDLRWIVTEVHLEAAAEIERLRAELAGREAEGFVLVPVEPTGLMVDAGRVAQETTGQPDLVPENAYRAMIAAALTALRGAQ